MRLKLCSVMFRRNPLAVGFLRAAGRRLLGSIKRKSAVTRSDGRTLVTRNLGLPLRSGLWYLGNTVSSSSPAGTGIVMPAHSGLEGKCNCLSPGGCAFHFEHWSGGRNPMRGFREQMMRIRGAWLNLVSRELADEILVVPRTDFGGIEITVLGSYGLWWNEFCRHICQSRRLVPTLPSWILKFDGI